MKKRVCRKSAAAIMALTASLTVCSSFLVLASEKATITVPMVADKDALKDYIDDDGDFASDETLNYKETSAVHKIEITQPGTLILCPVDTDSSYGSLTLFSLYSNKTLTSPVFNMGCLDTTDNTDVFGEIYLEPGTYYYTLYNDEFLTTNRLVTFLGLVPDETESLIEDGTEEAVPVAKNKDTDQTDLEEENKKLKEEIEFLKQIMEEAGIEITDF